MDRNCAPTGEESALPASARKNHFELGIIVIKTIFNQGNQQNVFSITSDSIPGWHQCMYLRHYLSPCKLFLLTRRYQQKGSSQRPFAGKSLCPTTASTCRGTNYITCQFPVSRRERAFKKMALCMNITAATAQTYSKQSCCQKCCFHMLHMIEA